MELTLLLAKLFGLYIAIVGLGFLINLKLVMKVVDEFAKNKNLIFGTGMLTLLIGLLLVFNHNIWEASWGVIITVIAWIVVVKGGVRVLFPKACSFVLEKVNKKMFWVVAEIILILFGIYLAYMGFSG